MSWIVRDLAGNIIGTVEKATSGESGVGGCVGGVIMLLLALPLIGLAVPFLALWGWIWVTVSGVKEGSIIKIFLMLLMVASIPLCIFVLPGALKVEENSDLSGLQNASGVAMAYLAFGGFLFGVVSLFSMGKSK